MVYIQCFEVVSGNWRLLSSVIFIVCILLREYIYLPSTQQSFYFALHVSTLMGHYQVLLVTHYLLLKLQRNVLTFYVYIYNRTKVTLTLSLNDTPKSVKVEKERWIMTYICKRKLRTRPRIPSQIPRIACGGRSFLTLVLPLNDPSCLIETTLFWPPTGRLSLLTSLNPPPCLKLVFCSFKVTIGLVRSYMTLAITRRTWWWPIRVETCSAK
jgi:hypothetical protein